MGCIPDTTCAVCGGKILLAGIVLQKEMKACGIERTYYTCPHCGFEYTVMLTDEQIRSLMKRRDELRGYADPWDARKAKEFEKTDKQIRRKLDILNGKTAVR